MLRFGFSMATGVLQVRLNPPCIKSLGTNGDGGERGAPQRAFSASRIDGRKAHKSWHQDELGSTHNARACMEEMRAETRNCCPTWSRQGLHTFYGASFNQGGGQGGGNQAGIGEYLFAAVGITLWGLYLLLGKPRWTVALLSADPHLTVSPSCCSLCPLP